ncbi:MAG: murein transglycosylase A [Alphaproteobacteria bacterium]|nr:murein transglycosylase A [Alphaproteobacteria bacterium]
MRFILLLLVPFVFSSCALFEEKPRDHLSLAEMSFADLDGWSGNAPLQALDAFRVSCGEIAHKNVNGTLGVGGSVAVWQRACVAATLAPQTEDGARAYFEQYFTPYAASGNDGDEGLFTGYYTPQLQGSLTQIGAFQTPLYQRPSDLIAADLGAFKQDLKGQRIVGKVSGSNFVPYDERAEIARGSLATRAPVLAWVDDPASAFFLEVQGSGLVRLTDGSIMPVGYDAANGRAYVAIGRVLADKGAIDKPVTMPGIRAWLAAHPDQAQQIMNANPSYVFFRRLPDNQILGAEGVALTPGRSLAVDPAFVPLGAPLWLDTVDGQGASLRRLMVAQDTGGAIKGPVRGDVFWGAGEDAAMQAGAMQSRGRYYLLLPKTDAR